MDEQKKRNLKIAIRFLKEIGLFNAWKEYESSSLHFYDLWYVDSIFSDTSFTKYLQVNKGIHLSDYISDIFVSYLTLYFNEDIKNNKFIFKYNGYDTFNYKPMLDKIKYNYGHK